MNDLTLQVAAVIAAGIVSKPGQDLDDPKAVAKTVVDLAKAIIVEAGRPGD